MESTPGAVLNMTEGCTYSIPAKNKDNNIRKSRQCIAISDNGRVFVKQKEVIDTPDCFTQHHRDPKVWRGKDSWWMLVGAQKKI